MRIGELARRMGVATSLLRFYEEQGLLAPASRSDAGYRVYPPEAIGRVAFIQRAKTLGLSLREIRQLVQDPGDSPAIELARLRHAIAHKLADTQRRLAELEALRRELEALHERLGHGVAVCGHVGDCGCWMPTGEEVTQVTSQVRVLAIGSADSDKRMPVAFGGIRPVAMMNEARKAGEAAACSCCDCTCPSDDGSCSCCGCSCE